MTTVAVALGSNLGDRAAHLDWAVERLRSRLHGLRVSSYFETKPADVDDAQPMYLNAAAVGKTDAAAHDLLAWLLILETDRGRVRTTPRAARTLDLDLILYGDRAINQPGLIVPHPRFRERRFVLEPLAEIAPDLIDPSSGERVDALLRKV